ncbi:MAG: DUF4116 domain-containing protein, partial [Rhodobacteraceae bacterium]|nr:DUF4116 domain-containing protein [Paracoccaceae bacterium]
MLGVIAHNGYSLRHASERLRSDKSFLLRAVDAGLYYDAIGLHTTIYSLA